MLLVENLCPMHEALVKLHIRRDYFYSILWMSYFLFITRVIVGNLSADTEKLAARGGRESLNVHGSIAFSTIRFVFGDVFIRARMCACSRGEFVQSRRIYGRGIIYGRN